MSGRDPIAEMAEAAQGALPPATAAGVTIGELIGMADDGRTPLVLYPGQPGTAALRARTVIDLHGAHIGRQAVLMFEQADPRRPIVMGLLQESGGWPDADAGMRIDHRPRPQQVEIDADGERLLVSAKEQLVLRCGKASITLTSSGKVLIQGSYLLSRSSGVNRIKGGAVQLN